MPTLDRLVEFDERSRAYPVRALLERRGAVGPRSYTWRCPDVLDQGSEGACVGFAWAHEAGAYPKRWATSNEVAFDVYRRARQLDIWEGEDYDGTSVLAGAKSAVERGWLKEYRWAFSLDDLLTAVSRTGPVVMGTWWWSEMWEPDERGFIEPRGQRIGGHAYIINSVSVRRRDVGGVNSWGLGWGDKGRFRMTWDAVEALLHDEGECCVPVFRPRPR